MTEKGTLLIGVEYNGVVHKDFELRSQKVRDSAEAIDALGGNDNQLVASAHIYAKRLTIGTIPKDKITPDMILDMDEADFEQILAANERLKKNVQSGMTSSADISDSSCA
jgi:hypothetical protein